jgi:hypothetical protein
VVDKNWSGIQAQLLSTSHGEFSKFFCSQTDREINVFDESGARCCEQLFNMIDLCKVFSCGKDRSCRVFCSLFDVDSGNLDKLQKALESLQQSANGTRISRNKVAHNLLIASESDFKELVVNAQKLLQSVLSIVSCVTDTLLTDHATNALAEIDSIRLRDIQVATPTEDERQKSFQYHRELLELHEQHHQLIEQHGRLQQENHNWRDKCGRKFDSVARCLKSHIQDKLTEGQPTRIFSHFCDYESQRIYTRIR